MGTQSFVHVRGDRRSGIQGVPAKTHRPTRLGFDVPLLLVVICLFLMAGTIFALVAVLIIQDTRLGSVRSLFRGSIQPSELAKFGIVIYLSVWLHNRRDMLKSIYLALLPLSVIMGVVGGLIAMQPDLSAVITIGLLGTLMFFLAGGSLKHFLYMMAIGIIVGVIVMKSGFFPTGDRKS